MGDNGGPLWRGITFPSPSDSGKTGACRFIRRSRSVAKCAKYNGLWLHEDEQLIAQVLSDRIAPEELAEAICSANRIEMSDALH